MILSIVYISAVLALFAMICSLLRDIAETVLALVDIHAFLVQMHGGNFFSCFLPT